jgi:uncharacterized protein (TIGR03382 family)
VDPVARLTAHHVSTVGIAVELGVIVLVALLLAGIWWRGRRRRATRPPARMRDDR